MSNDSIELKKLKFDLARFDQHFEQLQEEIEIHKKTIDLFETHATIKDYQILKLRDEITELKEALEKTE